MCGASDMDRGSVESLSVMLELRRKNVRLWWRRVLMVVWMMGDGAMVRMVASRLLLRWGRVYRCSSSY
jgi:hypothetical protein